MGAQILRKLRAWGICLMAVFVLQGAAAEKAAAAQTATLIYSGNLDGELEPCGCTAEGDLGGIRSRS